MSAQPPPDEIVGLVTLLRALTDVKWSPPRVQGKLSVTTEILQVLNALSPDASNAIEVREVQGPRREPDEVKAGTDYTVSLTLSNPAVASYLYWDLDELLRTPRNLLTIPSNYYLVGVDYCSWEDQTKAPDYIKHYHDAVSFAELVKAAAFVAHPRGEVDVAVFLALGEPITIGLTYRAADLRPLDRLDNLKLDMTNQNYANTRKDLFQKAVAQIVGSADPSHAFGHLLEHFAAFYRNFRGNLRLFEQAFDFETQKERLEADKRDLMQQYHSVITDAQSKLLAIPASLLLVGSQMKPATSPDSPWYTGNLVVLLASIAVTVLMWLLTNFQHKQIATVKAEVQARRMRWEQEAPDLASDTKIAFEELGDSAQTVGRAINIVRIVTLGVQLVAVALFVYYAPPLRDLAASLIEKYLPAVPPSSS